MTATFSREESGHCIRVLRMTLGDTINFTDGKGNIYEGVITIDDPHKMQAYIEKVIEDFGKRAYNLHIAISPLKNNDRLEWFIEKAVEMGIDEITPLICTRSEKNRIKRERIENLILSAMKQSVKAFLPRLNEPVKINDFLSGNYKGLRLIAHCNPEPGRKAVTEVISRGENVVIMIGPEGDFTNEEVTNAVKAGFTSVHIGSSRLRTETAGVAACCSVYLINI